MTNPLHEKMNLWQAMWKMTWIATTLTLGANALAASTTPQKEKRVELVFNRRAVSAPPDITKIPKTVSVLTFGASGDGVQDDAAAIQRALDSDAATVAIPAGTYRIGQTLLVGSGTTVQADAQAVIRLADGAGTNVNTFLISNRHPVRGDKNIVVAGGIWDGNNAHNTRGADGDMSGYTGTAINFINVTNLALRSLTVRNPDAFSIRVGEVEDFLIEDITLDHSVIRPNQDGVHVGGFSKRGIIRRIKAIHPNTPNDDMIALNADDDVLRVLNLGMKLGPITDILVDDVQAEGAYNFVRLLSNGSLINNITVRNVTGSCRTYAVNINRWRFAIGAGEIHNVLLENFDVTKTAGVDLALIYITLNIDNLHILDFQRIDTPDAVPAATLYLSNGLENILEDGEGNQQSVSTYTLPSGNIPDLWINRQP